MNCPVNYKDPDNEDEQTQTTQPKSVTWKRVVATTFKTPQECDEDNSSKKVAQRTNMQAGRTTHPRSTLRVAKLQLKT